MSTIWTYALQESQQYEHMLYRNVNNINIGIQESQQHEHTIERKVNKMKYAIEESQQYESFCNNNGKSTILQ